MADYRYLTKTSAIKDFLKKIQETGVPEKVSEDYIKTIGFTSSSDRPLVPLFRSLGFFDSSGVPTDTYREYRNKAKAPKVLARATKTYYSALFATYPDAHRRDADALANFFSSTTSLGERAVSAIVNTFKTLCEIADFEGVEEKTDEDESEKVSRVEKKSRIPPTALSGGPTIAINIQLQLPITENEAVYEKLFASLRKNLLEPTKEEK